MKNTLKKSLWWTEMHIKFILNITHGPFLTPCYFIAHIIIEMLIVKGIES